MAGAPSLTYRTPLAGRDYWINDAVLPDPLRVAQRCYAHTAWELGAPMRPEPWPGMRAADALLAAELALVEAWVRQVTGARKLWLAATSHGATLHHNTAQLVGMADSGPRPHTDSRLLCRYAAVIYRTPQPDPDTGTAFYRLRYPNGTLGGASRTSSIGCCCTGPTWSILPAPTSASSMPTSA